MAFGSSVLTHKKEQQIKIAGEFKPTVDCLCAIRRGFVAVYGGFVGMYELVVNDKVQRENINSINYFRDDQLVQQAISDMEKLMEARQKSKEQERSSTKKSVLDALRSLKTKKQEQPAQEQDKPKKAKKKGMEL